jgi:hypothetical protein
MNRPGWVNSLGIGVPDDGEGAGGILLFQSWLVHGDAGESISRLMRNGSDARDSVTTPLC